MTDERIKEEFEEWMRERHDYKDICKVYGQGDVALQAMAFFEGFRAAERLAKIEVLEELRKDFDGQALNGHVIKRIDSILSSLKAGN